MGYLGILSGLYDIVLVGGVEQMTHQATETVTTGVASAMDYELEAMMGMTFPANFAMIANRYFYEYRNVKREMAMCAVNAHKNACLNPDAQMPRELELDKVLAAAPIAAPLSMFDCSLVTDGSAFAVLAAGETAERLSKKRIVDVAGSGHAGDTLTLYGKKVITSFASAKAAAHQAYAQAGLKPEDIDFAEVHDCFTITQIINTEDLGFFPAGKGGDAVAEGVTAMDGKKPINVSGGLKAKGHPIGATGISQIYEVVTQLRGEAGARQLKKADIGLTHNLGGTASTCVINIFKGR
jgi:acetyl-CoA C-acetyltransferase